MEEPRESETFTAYRMARTPGAYHRIQPHPMESLPWGPRTGTTRSDRLTDLLLG